MNILFQLFINFFNIGVFSFGGGYATLPFLYEIAEKYGWYTTSQLTDMIAVSSVTPGPIGINMATFAGFNTYSLFGSVVATGAIILPSYLIVTCVYKILDRFNENWMVKGAVHGLKPAGCALLTAVGIKLILTSNLHLLGALILICFILSGLKKKHEPIFYLGLSALIGLFAGLFHIIGV